MNTIPPSIQNFLMFPFYFLWIKWFKMIYLLFKFLNNSDFLWMDFKWYYFSNWCEIRTKIVHNKVSDHQKPIEVKHHKTRTKTSLDTPERERERDSVENMQRWQKRKGGHENITRNYGLVYYFTKVNNL